MTFPLWQSVSCIAIFAAALGSSLVAGVFFAFSAFVMHALGRLPAAQAIAVMQSINVAVINALFMAAFLGTTVLCLGIAVFALLDLQNAVSPYLFTGALLYLVGGFGVTMCCNVPRNNRLATLAPDDRRSTPVWTEYLRSWTAWNHARTVAAFTASALFIVALTL